MAYGDEIQLTHSRSGHILTNIGVWSPDGEWIAYDTRSTPAGDQFDGQRIEIVNVRTGKTRVLYRAHNGARCGVVTFHPREQRVVFIQGPEHPTADWQYSFCHRQGVIVDLASPGRAVNLDACDVTPPFTPGALRGGSHVHVWEPAGQWVSFTYEDHVLSKFQNETAEQEINLRNVGVSAPVQQVIVPKAHPRSHDGTYFSVLATSTVADPPPGSDQIKKAFEEGWIGTNGYVRADGTRQRHALAFQGLVVTQDGQTISEVFVADLPEDLRIPGTGPLAGTQAQRPRPPRGTVQRRLTFTAQRKYPGLQGPRHWLRSSPDGARIAFLMKDELGVVQLWTISPNGGPTKQLTHNLDSIGSAFTWSADGGWIAHVMDNSVCVTETRTGQTRRLTQRAEDTNAPRPEACVFAPDGKRIAYVRPVNMNNKFFNQIFVVGME
ncbi:MAG TPA: DUF3748 domain-containing protein [Verrucomicrobiae bacterium]|nr:DUF3748 domain-containing protein [Verrucomicrobiae bacterium]